MTTQTEALDRLIEAVKAGLWPDSTLALRSAPRDFAELLGFFALDRRTRLAWSAYHGSLDAAKALHEALLPGWDVDVDIRDVLSDAWIFSPKDDWHIIGTHEDPARAWILAILKAYRSTL